MSKFEYQKPQIKKIKEPSVEAKDKIAQKRFEKFAKNYVEVLEDQNIPEIYKYFISKPDIILVLAQLKPMTEIHFSKYALREMRGHSIIAEDKSEKKGKSDMETKWLQGLKHLLVDKFQVKTSDNTISEIFNDELISFSIFDPKQIRKKISEHENLAAWDDKDNLTDWINKNKAQGVGEGYVMGLLYGFPETAIDFFLKGQSLEGTDNQTIDSHGETYGVPSGPLADDVKEREQEKNSLFNILKSKPTVKGKNSEFIQIKKNLIASADTLDPEIRKFPAIGSYMHFLNDINIPSPIKMIIEGNEDLLMAVNKLRPLARINLPANINFDEFRKNLETRFGLSVKQIETGAIQEKGLFVFNPYLLRGMIKESGDFIPWDKEDDFFAWVNKNKAMGKNDILEKITALAKLSGEKYKSEFLKRLKGNDEYTRAIKRL